MSHPDAPPPSIPAIRLNHSKREVEAALAAAALNPLEDDQRAALEDLLFCIILLEAAGFAPMGPHEYENIAVEANLAWAEKLITLERKK